MKKFHHGVMIYLRSVNRLESETVKDGDPCLSTTRNVIVGSLKQTLAAAQEKSRQLGFDVQIISP